MNNAAVELTRLRCSLSNYVTTPLT